jgi:hypothetical protein
MKNTIQFICKLTAYIALINVNVSYSKEINLPSSVNIKYKANCAQSRYEIYYNSSWSNDSSKIIYIKYDGSKINIDPINKFIENKGLQLINMWCYKGSNSSDLKSGDAVIIARLGGPNQINRIEKSLLKINILSGKAEIINEVDKDEPHIQFLNQIKNK